MQAPGQKLLKVVSILFIVFGAIATIFSVIAVAGVLALVSAYGAAAEIGGIVIVSSILAIGVSAIELIIGILGASRSGKVEKAKFFINTGIALCVLGGISLVLGIASSGFQITSLIGFVLPILYIVGGTQNKKAMGTPAA